MEGICFVFPVSLCLTSVCMAVPDPPQGLQLSCDNAEDGTVRCSWNPPDKTHGLVREYIVRKMSSVLYSIYQNAYLHLTGCVCCAGGVQ